MSTIKKINGIFVPNTFVTGFTYNNSNLLTVSQNGKPDLNVYLNQFSGLTVSGNLSATSINTDYIDFNTNPTVPFATGGTLYYDYGENALSYKPMTNQNDVTVNIGQESLIRIYNQTGVKINNGQVLHITGATSAIPTVALANASKLGATFTDSLAQSSGVATHDIPNGEYGFMTNFGIVRDLNTSGFTVGQELFLSDTIDGAITNDPNNISYTSRISTIGWCLSSDPTSGKIFVKIENENPLQSLTQQEINVLLGNTISTGAYSYTGMTKASSTTVNVSPMRGWLVYNTYEYSLNPLVLNIYYSGGTNIPVTNINSSLDTYFLVNSGGTLYQQTTFPTPEERRNNIFLGRAVHPNKTSILNVEQSVDYDVSPMSSLRDLWTPIKLINQGVIPSTNGATLQFKTSSGTFWGNGIGWDTNELDPNSITIPAYSPAVFYYTTQTGGSFTVTANTIDTTNYDVGGVITDIPGNGNYTTQRIYMSQSGVIRIQYGQTSYPTLAKAIAAIPSETFVENSDNGIDCILIGLLTVKDGATALNNIDDAVFTLVSKFGEILGGTAGISTTTLQQAYNNSTSPEIITNSTLGGVQFRGGTGTNTDRNIIIENNGTNVTGYWQADGGLFVTSITGYSATINGNLTVTGNTNNIGSLSATTFYGSGIGLNNIPISGVTNLQSYLDSKFDKSGGTVSGLVYYRLSGETWVQNQTIEYISAATGNVLVTKEWVESLSFDNSTALAVNVATTTVLPACTYNTGTGGVGATLTRNINGTLGTIDTISSFGINDRILVKNQSSQLQNGVYQVTVVGNVSTPFVLTRTTDSDETVEFDPQIVIPSRGTQAGLRFAQTTADPVVGTNNIVYISVGNTSTFVTQSAAGTQTSGNIPFWTTVARDLSKGNSTDLFWNGTTKRLSVGVGASPSAKLDVSGLTKTTTLQITSGSTNGYVLTAIDSLGNTRWQIPTNVTGLTYDNNNKLTISRFLLPDLNVYLNEFSGLTVNGVVSATTFYGSGLGLNNIPISGVTNLQSSLDLKTNLILFNLHTGNTSNPHQTTFFNLVSTAHTHVISDVVSLQSSLDSKFDKSGGTVNGNVIINGNVSILGTATTINTETLSVSDNVITLNANYSGGTPFFGHSGIEVLRGSGTTAALLWEEQNLQWEAGLHGSTKRIILQGDSLALLTSGHTHPISEINNLQTTLDDKLSKSTGGTVLGFTSFNNGLSAYTSNDEVLIIPFKSVGFYDDGGIPVVGQTTIGGYFESSGGTNSYSLQLKDGTQGLNKVLVSKTNDGKANWSDTLNVNSVSATTYYGNFAYVSNIIATNSFSSSTYSTNVGDTQVVFSNNGSLSGTTNLTWSNSILNINGGLNVTGNTILQSVTASTGVISGNLNVNGNTVLKSITGNGETTLNGNLTVTGNTLVNGSVLALNNISANTKLFIITTPTSGVTSTQILMRNSTTGEVEITDNTSPNIFNYGLANAMINLNFLT